MPDINRFVTFTIPTRMKVKKKFYEEMEPHYQWKLMCSKIKTLVRFMNEPSKGMSVQGMDIDRVLIYPEITKNGNIHGHGYITCPQTNHYPIWDKMIKIKWASLVQGKMRYSADCSLVKDKPKTDKYIRKDYLIMKKLGFTKLCYYPPPGYTTIPLFKIIIKATGAETEGELSPLV